MMESKSKRNMLAMWLGIAGGILVIIGAIVQWQEKKAADKETDTAKKEANEWNTKFEKSQKDLYEESLKNNLKTDELAEANKKNFELSEQLNKKANDIIEYSQKVIEAQNQTINQVLGNGYGIIIGDFITPEGNYHFMLKNATENPIFPVTINYINVDAIANKKLREDVDNVYLRYEDYMPATKQIMTYPSLGGGRSCGLDFAINIKRPAIEYPLHFIFQITLKHVTLHQYCILTYDENSYDRYELSYRVYSYNKSTRKIDTLLEEGGLKIPDKVWDEKFFSRKHIMRGNKELPKK